MTIDGHEGQGRRFERAYGLDEVAIVPSNRTVDVDLVDISTSIAGINLSIPILGSAMDSVVSPSMAAALGKLGAAGVLNLEGVQTRYENPEAILKKVADVAPSQYISLMQSVYQGSAICHDLVRRCIRRIKAAGAPVLVSSTPKMAKELGAVAVQAGIDAFLIQSTVIAPRFFGKQDSEILNLADFCQSMPVPVLVGNTVSGDVAYDIFQSGVGGIFVGIGPGSACTTRGVLGVGVPMASAIDDVARARNRYHTDTGVYVPIIADGGIVQSGDICKAMACGADAVMIGSPIARASESPGYGFHWGMATPNSVLPRGARIEVGRMGSLEKILLGPSDTDDGSQNLAGALKVCLSTVGVRTIREFHGVQMVVAPSLLTEGKVYQKAQNVGMYRQ